MRSFQIQDIREFMKQLLLKDTFDAFLISEATITTFAAFHINGKFHPDFLNAQEKEQLTSEACGYTSWKRIRPYLFDLIKGKNTPLSMQIVFRLSPKNIERLLTQSGLSIRLEEVDGLFLNIRYEGKALMCVSGTSLRVFTMDKSLEHTWDETLERFFRQKQIPFL